MIHWAWAQASQLPKAYLVGAPASVARMPLMRGQCWWVRHQSPFDLVPRMSLTF